MMDFILSATLTKIDPARRVTLQQMRDRLEVCRTCPSNVVVLNVHGRPYTCGPLRLFGKQEEGKPCGCVLKIKAADKTQNCPYKHWPKLT